MRTKTKKQFLKMGSRIRIMRTMMTLFRAKIFRIQMKRITTKNANSGRFEDDEVVRDAR